MKKLLLILLLISIIIILGILSTKVKSNYKIIYLILMFLSASVLRKIVKH